jgi:hypothetical protein
MITPQRKIKWQIWQCFVLVAVFFAMFYVGSDPEAEHAAAQGPTAKERVEIISRQPVSRVEYETLQILGWDKDPANNQVIVLDKDGEPQLVDYKRK